MAYKLTEKGLNKVKTAKVTIPKPDHLYEEGNKKGLTYPDIADLAHVSESSVKRFFYRQDGVSEDYFRAILQALNLNIDDLIEGEDYVNDRPFDLEKEKAKIAQENEQAKQQQLIKKQQQIKGETTMVNATIKTQASEVNVNNSELTFADISELLKIKDSQFFFDRIEDESYYSEKLEKYIYFSFDKIFKFKYKDLFFQWLQQDYVTLEEKEEVLTELVTFEDNCDYYYTIQCHAIAAESLKYFKTESPYVDTLLDRLIRWAFGEHELDSNNTLKDLRWQEYPDHLKYGARDALLNSDNALVIAKLTKTLSFNLSLQELVKDHTHSWTPEEIANSIKAIKYYLRKLQPENNSEVLTEVEKEEAEIIVDPEITVTEITLENLVEVIQNWINHDFSFEYLEKKHGADCWQKLQDFEINDQNIFLAISGINEQTELNQNHLPLAVKKAIFLITIAFKDNYHQNYTLLGNLAKSDQFPLPETVGYYLIKLVEKLNNSVTNEQKKDYSKAIGLIANSLIIKYEEDDHEQHFPIIVGSSLECILKTERWQNNLQLQNCLNLAIEILIDLVEDNFKFDNRGCFIDESTAIFIYQACCALGEIGITSNLKLNQKIIKTLVLFGYSRDMVCNKDMYDVDSTWDLVEDLFSSINKYGDEKVIQIFLEINYFAISIYGYGYLMELILKFHIKNQKLIPLLINMIHNVNKDFCTGGWEATSLNLYGKSLNLWKSYPFSITTEYLIKIIDLYHHWDGRYSFFTHSLNSRSWDDEELYLNCDEIGGYYDPKYNFRLRNQDIVYPEIRDLTHEEKQLLINGILKQYHQEGIFKYGRTWKYNWKYDFLAQEMEYLEFFELFHQKDQDLDSKETKKETFNFNKLPQLINDYLKVMYSIILDDFQFIYVNIDQIVDHENPALEIYLEMVKSGLPQTQETRPKTLSELKVYWELELKEIKHRPVLVLYSPTLNILPETVLSQLDRLNQPICLFLSEKQENCPLPQFKEELNDFLKWLLKVKHQMILTD